jgi:MoaA/NifB/PqqE/SkfB family radical SAM enzyme
MELKYDVNDSRNYIKQFNPPVKYDIHPRDVDMNVVEHQGYDEYKTVSINWTLNNECQYDCKYCYAKRDMVVKRPDCDYKAVIKKLKLITVPFDICLVGGEPTLHPDIFDIIEDLAELKHCNDIALTTNLYGTQDFWKKFDNLNHKGKLLINVSLHIEYYNNNFLKNIDVLKAYKNTEFDCTLNVFAEEKYYDKMKHALAHIDDLLVISMYKTPDFDPGVDDDFINQFSEKEIGMKMEVNGTDQYYPFSMMQKYGLNKFKGWKCTAQDLVITQEGDIKNMCTDEPIKIYTAKHRDAMVICPKDDCPCDPLLLFKKCRI